MQNLMRKGFLIFPEIGPLCPNAAKQAIVKPLEKEGVEITDEGGF